MTASTLSGMALADIPAEYLGYLSRRLKQNAGQYCLIIPGLWDPQASHAVT